MIRQPLLAYQISTSVVSETVILYLSLPKYLKVKYFKYVVPYAQNNASGTETTRDPDRITITQIRRSLVFILRLCTIVSINIIPQVQVHIQMNKYYFPPHSFTIRLVHSEKYNLGNKR